MFFLRLLPFVFLFLPGLAPHAEDAPLKETAVDIGTKIQLVQSLAEQGKIDEAIESLQQLQSEAPAPYRTRLQYDLANLLFLQGRYPEARLAYQKVIHFAQETDEMVRRSRERIERMKDKETKQTDRIAIQLIDIESTLEIGQLPPDGAFDFLRKIEEDPLSPYIPQAVALRLKIVEIENKKSLELLNEARVTFDRRRDYRRVREILESIKRDFSHSEEMPSVEILLKETRKRLGQN